MDTLNSQQRNLGWGLGATQQKQLSAKGPKLVHLYQLLLFTMPGTPVFTYGDEIGLTAGEVSYRTEQMFKCFINLTDVAECNVCLSLFCFLIRVLLPLRWFGTWRRNLLKELKSMRLLWYEVFSVNVSLGKEFLSKPVRICFDCF